MFALNCCRRLAAAEAPAASFDRRACDAAGGPNGPKQALMAALDTDTQPFTSPRTGRRPARDGARGSMLLTPHKVKANELLTTGSQSFPAPACRSSLPELPGRFQRHARGLAATLDVHVPLDRALLDLAPAILQLHELCVHDVLRVHLRGQVLGAGRRRGAPPSLRGL